MKLPIPKKRKLINKKRFAKLAKRVRESWKDEKR
jgi:hypothetical protein